MRSPSFGLLGLKRIFQNGINTQGEKVVVEAAQNFEQPDGSTINRTIVDGKCLERSPKRRRIR
ncbi:MAG: hypothetical protein ACKO3R_10875 [bacterium]